MIIEIIDCLILIRHWKFRWVAKEALEDEDEKYQENADEEDNEDLQAYENEKKGQISNVSTYQGKKKSERQRKVPENFKDYIYLDIQWSSHKNR